MKIGSIVELSKKLTAVDFELMQEKAVSIKKDVPYIIEMGPKMQEWERHGIKYIVHAITLDAFPKVWFNSTYFSEVQSPDEISAEEMVAACVPGMIAACL